MNKRRRIGIISGLSIPVLMILLPIIYFIWEDSKELKLSNEEVLNLVGNGMTMKEVEDSIGGPLDKVGVAGREGWIYHNFPPKGSRKSATLITIFFKNGKVSEVDLAKPRPIVSKN